MPRVIIVLSLAVFSLCQSFPLWSWGRFLLIVLTAPLAFHDQRLLTLAVAHHHSLEGSSPAVIGQIEHVCLILLIAQHCHDELGLQDAAVVLENVFDEPLLLKELGFLFNNFFDRLLWLIDGDELLRWLFGLDVPERLLIELIGLVCVTQNELLIVRSVY